MKLVKILSALAVIAAAGMVAAGCNSPAGSENGGEAAFTEASAPESAGAPLVADTSGTKTVKIKFNVKNGGGGLLYSEAMVCQADYNITENVWNYYNIVHDGAFFANDYTITITVPESVKSLVIFWKASEPFCGTFYVGVEKLAESGSVTLDYNGWNWRTDKPKVATKNLLDPPFCYRSGDIFSRESGKTINELWDELFARAREDVS